MEGHVLKWTNFIKGWKVRYLGLDNNCLFISKNKFDTNRKYYDLRSSKLIDENKKRQFCLDTGDNKLYFKTNTDDEKGAWIEKINDSVVQYRKSMFVDKSLVSFQVIEDKVSISLPANNLSAMPLMNNNYNNNPNDKFSQEYVNNKNQIELKSSIHQSRFDIVVTNFTHLQNLFLELNYAIENLNSQLMISKFKNKDDFTKIYANLFNIKQEMKDYLDMSIESMFSYKEEMEKKFTLQAEEADVLRLRNQTFYFASDTVPDRAVDDNSATSKKIFTTNEGEKTQNDHDSSFEDCIEEANISNSLEILKTSEENQIKFIKTLSFVITDFCDLKYHFEPRESLPVGIKCSNSMVSDLIKSLSQSKIALPIYYNEPISMLQKLCEPFSYSELLYLSAMNETNEMKLVYISAYIAAEVSMAMSRMLKPFNPILGETFEYFDNKRKFRYFSEQVSHDPPISAYVCESEDFVVYGDSRCKNKFKILRGAMEISFTSKTNVIFKKTNDHFVYNKPTVLLKGLVMGTPHFDYCGEVVIADLNNPHIKAELDFFEEGRKGKPLGYFEGKVLADHKVVYIIKGNSSSSVEYFDKNGNNPIEVWRINEEDYQKNDSSNYVLPKYTCNLNYLTSSLLDILPPTDSRMRPDQRALEEGKLDFAQQEKARIENKQRARHRQFDEEKKVYEANYFSDVFDQKTEEYIYIYKGDYWSDRSKHKYDHLYDIFA